MDSYKKIKCVQGLIMSLDEQLYQAKQLKQPEEGIPVIINEYYKAIKDFLNKENKDG